MHPYKNLLLLWKNKYSHRSLCPTKFGSVQQVPAHLADELLEQGVEDATENVLMSSEEMVLMQTAKGNVFNKVNGKQENVRMLFDSGSQRTYIAVDLAKKLSLKLGEKSKISLVTFGSEKPQPLETPSTVLNIELKDGSALQITANVIPKITGEMQRRPFNTNCLQNWEYLWKNNALADTLPTEIESSTIPCFIWSSIMSPYCFPRSGIFLNLFSRDLNLPWASPWFSGRFVTSSFPVSLLFRYFNFSTSDKLLFLSIVVSKFKRPKTLSILVYPHYMLACPAEEVSPLHWDYVVFEFAVKILFADLPLTAAFSVVNSPCDYTFLQ